jgi:hypothetical protein
MLVENLVNIAFHNRRGLERTRSEIVMRARLMDANNLISPLQSALRWNVR